MLLLLITLLDGSAVNLRVENLKYEVQTKYGALVIPAGDVLECGVGVHTEIVLEAKVREAALELGDTSFAKRDAAMKFLRANKRCAWKYLVAAKGDKDLEVKKRVATLLDGYISPPQMEDVFKLSDGVVVGVMKNVTIDGVSDSLGKLSIPLSQIASIVRRRDAFTFSLGQADGWFDAGYIATGRLDVSSSGTIDLFPQGPGQYVASPSGMKSGTQFGGYPSGALLGRLNGKIFLIGEEFHNENMDRGRLEVRVNGVSWSAQWQGEYVVEVK